MKAWLKTMLAAIIVITAMAVVAGCGSDDESGTAADSSSLSKEEFIKKANAVCIDSREGALERVGIYKKKHNLDRLPEAVGTELAVEAALLATVDSETDAIAKLEPPEGDEEEIEAILASLRAEHDKAKQGTKKSSKAVEEYFPESDKMLSAYGLTQCVKNE